MRQGYLIEGASEGLQRCIEVGFVTSEEDGRDGLGY